VHWRLLTTHPVQTVAEARQIVGWYRVRWCIERVFRSMKAHTLRIEDLQVEDARGFAKLAIIALIAAVRAMQPVMARDGATGPAITDAVAPADMPALEWLSASLEGRTEKPKNPTPRRVSSGSSGSSPALAAGPATPPRDTSPPDPKPPIMDCSDWKEY